MTRATLSLFRGDIKGYVSYNVMALPVLVAILLLVHAKKLKHKKTAFIIGAIILLINLVYYAIRLKLKLI